MPMKKTHRSKSYLIAFFDEKKKKFLNNWDPENRCVRYYIPSMNEGTIRLFSPESEVAVRIMHNLDEKRWKTVKVYYDVFSDLLKEQGLIKS